MNQTPRAFTTAGFEERFMYQTERVFENDYAMHKFYCIRIFIVINYYACSCQTYAKRLAGAYFRLTYAAR